MLFITCLTLWGKKIFKISLTKGREIYVTSEIQNVYLMIVVIKICVVNKNEIWMEVV